MNWLVVATLVLTNDMVQLNLHAALKDMVPVIFHIANSQTLGKGRWRKWKGCQKRRSTVSSSEIIPCEALRRFPWLRGEAGGIERIRSAGLANRGGIPTGSSESTVNEYSSLPSGHSPRGGSSSGIAGTLSQAFPSSNKDESNESDHEDERKKV